MIRTILAIIMAFTSCFCYAQNTFPASGNVGIGTSNPTANLQVNGTTILSNPAGNDYNENLRLPPSANGDYSCIAIGAVPQNYGTGAGQWSIIRYPLAQNYMFGLRYIGADYLSILTNGNMGVGTTTPDSKLAVNGTVHAREVKVDLTGWPDYVFKKDYSLLTLDEVEDYINRNQHLPDMPSDAEVEKNGIKLGEIAKLQTKKIEELTLYLLEKNKFDKEKDLQLQAQQEQLKVQQQQIEELKQQQESLIKALKALPKQSSY